MNNTEQLLMLCKEIDFDEELAYKLIEGENLNKAIESHKTTFLYTAVDNSNVRMVKILLEKGADPNYFTEYDGPALWGLQYPGFYEMEEKEQLELTKMLLDYGADPNIVWDCEPLFDDIVFTVFNEVGDDRWKYLLKFLLYLVAYGGNTEYCSPKLYEEFDKTCLDEYKLYVLGSYGEIWRNRKKIADI